MAQLIVRKLDEALVRKLKARAGREGISTEEAHRRILQQALEDENDLPKTELNFKEFLLTMPNVGRDEDFERNKDPMREVDL